MALKHIIDIMLAGHVNEFTPLQVRRLDEKSEECL
jgi:hypothetical protein